MDALSAMRHDQQPAPAILNLLRSFGVGESKVLLCLAARLPGPADIDDPTRAARVILGQWFARICERPDMDAEDAFLLGRAAFVALDGGTRWSNALLAEPAPDDLVTKLRQGLPFACPTAAPTVMVVQSLDGPAPFTAIAAVIRGGPRPVRPA